MIIELVIWVAAILIGGAILAWVFSDGGYQ